MKKRFIYLITLIGSLLALFVVLKPIFMLYNRDLFKDVGVLDYLAVMLHGLKLDSSVTGYILIIPMLIIIATIFFPKINIRRIFIPYYIFIAVIISSVFVIDTSLYEHWTFKLDAMVFFYLDSPAAAFASVSVFYIVIRFLFIILIAYGIYKLLRFITPTSLPKVKNKILSLSAMAVLVGGVFVGIRGGVTESTANIGHVYFSENQSLNHSAVNPIFSLLYSLGKSEDFAKEFDFFPEQERAEIYDGLFPQAEEKPLELLNTKRPNILIIQLESFMRNVVEVLGGEPGITPEFNRLSKEGIFFTQCYAGSFRSDRGVICTFSGYLGQPTASIMKIPAKSGTLPSIASTLGSVGYNTDFVYGGDINFTNMQSYLRSTGYQTLISDKDFSLKEQQTHKWGVNDEFVYDYLYKEIITRKDSLWHTGLFTLSSHDPFIVPYSGFPDNVRNAFAYADHHLGKFIEKLKASDSWDDLLVIIISDHGFRYPSTVLNHEPELFHIPMLWLGGAIKEPQRVDKIVGQTDLPATLLGQLGLPHSEFEFSRDVFSSSYEYPFAFSTFNNGFIFKDSTGVTVYGNEADMIIIDEPTPSEKRLDRGKAILQTLYDNLGTR